MNGVATIQKIIVWNRTEVQSGDLSNSDVRILDGSGKEVNTRHIDKSSGVQKIEFDFNDAVGSYVEVQLRGTNYLQLAEAQVF